MVLLVIDQFEELFTLTTDEGVRRRFLDSLEHALRDLRCPVRLVLTLRADFYDRPLRYGDFARLLGDSTVPVLPLAADELERAIVDPAARAGATFEPGLVSRIVADVADQPSALPVLQYALTRLYDERVSGMLTVAAYEGLGGVAGALAGRAEDLFGASAPAEQAATRRLFGRLVTVGDGVEDTRRRVNRSEAGHDGATGAVTAAVIERYGAARLLSFDRDPTTREPTVEVAHEALIRQWPRLRTWLDEDRDTLRVQRHLADAAHAWHQRGRDAAELYRGARLAAAREWADANPDGPNPLEWDYLNASDARQRQETERERRQLRRLRTSLVALAVIAGVAVLAGSLAAVQRSDARRNATLAADRASEAVTARDRATAARRLSDLNRLVAESRAEAAQTTDLSLLLALEANRLEDSIRTQSTVLNALMAEPRFLGGLGDAKDPGVIPWVDADGQLHSYELDGTLRLWDITARRETGPPVQVGQPFRGGGFPPALGRSVVAFSGDGVINVFDVSTGRQIGPEIRPALSDGRTSWPLAFSPDERTIYVGGGPFPLPTTPGFGLLARYDLATGVALGEPWRGHAAGVIDVSVSADGRRVATASRDQQILVWDASTGQPALPPLVGHRSAVFDVAWSADGTFLASVDASNPELIVWDSATGTPHARTAVPHGVLPRVTVSADGRLIATAGPERRLVVWDAATLSQVGQPITLQSVNYLPVFTGDGRAIVNGGPRLTLFAVDGSPALGAAVPGAGPSHVVWSPDGAMLVRIGMDGRAFVVDAATGLTIGELPDVPADSPLRYGQALSFSPDGRTLAIAGNQTLKLYDVATRTVRAETSTGIAGLAYLIRFRPDGAVLAVSGRQGASMYDATTAQPIGEPIVIPARGTGGLAQLGFSADGTILYLYPFQDPVVAYDIAARRVVATVEPFGGAIDVRPDGEVLATAEPGGKVRLRDATTLQPIGEPIAVSAQEVAMLRFTPDGKRLVAWSLDQVARLVDLDAGAVFEPGFPTAVLVTEIPEISPDGARLATRSQHGAVLWELDPAEWKARACLVAGRNLTSDEWARYLPNHGEHRKTCEQWDLPS